MKTSEKTKDIIRKYYSMLGFPERFDAEFASALESVYIPDGLRHKDYDLDCDDGEKNLLAHLYFCEELHERYRELGIPDEIFIDTMHDIAVWTETWSNVKGKLHLGELLWLKRHFEARLFKLGRLQFCIAGAEHEIPKYSIKKDEPLVEVHIQAGGKLSPEDCRASIDAARAFFAKYFPSYEYSVFTCHSWLLDEKLREVLRAGSNILAFGDMFDRVHADDSNALIRYIFAWDTTEENLAERVPQSSLGERVKAKVLAGESFHETLGVILK